MFPWLRAVLFVSMVLLPGRVLGQTKAGDPIKTSLCEIAAFPEEFDRKMVTLAADIMRQPKTSPILLVDNFCSVVEISLVQNRQSVRARSQYRALERHLRDRSKFQATIVGIFRLNQDGSGTIALESVEAITEKQEIRK